tara:strand:- start:1372 stop:1554 length:183 start_codon:yes stop_codon:yes gene_type:complete
MTKITELLEERLDGVEDQLQAVLLKQRETQFLLLKIEGGITALKWTGAVVGFLLGFGECL